MLIHLEIRNIALIDKVNIEFGKGLNILSGETGAGKSIVIDSINAILGGRVYKELIRTGTEKASIQGVFQVESEKINEVLLEYGLEHEEDNTLIISRQFNFSGKNTCRINGKIVTVSMLKEIGELLIDVHGQHDNQSLLKTEGHIELLDLFGGEKILQLKKKYESILIEYKDIKKRLADLSGDDKERERKVDLLKFQVDEIQKANLKINEDVDLESQRLVLSNAEKIIKSLSTSYGQLCSESNYKSNALDIINDAVNQLLEIKEINESYGEILKRLEDIVIQLEDITQDIRRERDSLEFEPEVLTEVEERLDLIYKMKRKYGDTIKDIIEYGQKKKLELKEIINSEEVIGNLKLDLRKVRVDLINIAKEITSERRKAAEILESRIVQELSNLEMRQVQFKVDIDQENTLEAKKIKFYINGIDKVEFFISPNAGEPLKPLSKIASGGEMSRVMLGIKTVLAKVDKIPTLIFDEIDTGVSGKAAQKVGEKLSFISRNHQVICITHLAQIASLSDQHFLIEKYSREQSTCTEVKKLSGENLKVEIARILGGANISNNTLKLAGEMLNNAKKFKNDSLL